MQRIASRITALSLVVLSGAFQALADEPAGTVQKAVSPEVETFFETRVRPVLIQRCQECHGADAQEGGLRLDSRAHLLAGADGRAVVVPGKPDESPLVAAIRRGGEVRMPPDEALPQAELEALVRWVELGVPWPGAPDVDAPTMTRQQRFEQQRTTHWAFQPVVHPPLPVVSQGAWPRTAIDRFVLAELEAENLPPSDEAERHTLLRRASFDLLGLPPTPEEAERFANDSQPDAYERLIDRLLASPRYGERWGRHWLDVARYADTRGYSFGRERRYPYSYTYRDYVIQSFNRDLPYDRFVLEQLAADLLPDDGDPSRLAALGFLTVGRKFNNRHDDLDDQIDVVCRGLLGLTVACARCHDHKYDAIPTHDYYSLYGVFASSVEPEELPVIGRPADAAAYEKFQAEVQRLQGEVDAYHRQARDAMLDAARRQTTEYLARAWSGEPEESLRKQPFISLRRDELRGPLIERWSRYLAGAVRPESSLWSVLHAAGPLTADEFSGRVAEVLGPLLERPEGVADGQLNPHLKRALGEGLPASKAALADLYGRLFTQAYVAWREAGAAAESLAALPEELRPWAEVLVAAGGPTDVGMDELPRYLNRAEQNKSRELVKKVDQLKVQSPGAPPRAMVVRENPQPHAPRVFIRGNHGRPGDPVPRQFLYVLSGPDRQPFQQGSGRLELAREIIDPDNPLTRRVIANRIWMYHFGQPLVDTPSDFGIRTERPRHHGLLDYLAWKLIASGWSLKALHREILLSSTYRQRSVAREDGLARDPENRLYWRMNRRRLEFEPLRDSLLAVAGRLETAMGGRPVELFGDAPSGRRTIYGFIDRQDLPNLLRVFDFASPDQSNARRPQTTVPQQALFLMNSPLVLRQAESVVNRPDLRKLEGIEPRIDRLYQILFARGATESERAIGRQYLVGDSADVPADIPLDAWRNYAQLLLLSNEFVFVD